MEINQKLAGFKNKNSTTNESHKKLIRNISSSKENKTIQNEAVKSNEVSSQNRENIEEMQNDPNFFKPLADKPLHLRPKVCILYLLQHSSQL